MKSDIHLKTKITSAEYQKLDDLDKLLYSRFSGSDEVYYILVSFVRTKFNKK